MTQSDAQARIADAASELERATYRADKPLGAFLKIVDEKQRAVYTALRAAYPDGYAKILALKISNLYVARFHYLSRHTILVSAPIQLMVDPCNACQLQCPGCVHSGNEEFQQRLGFDWPTGTLTEEGFESLIRLYGPFSFGIVFYNYGEPFLNKKTPRMIRRSKDFLVNSWVSSNLSLPKLDADAIVQCGLNCLFASIDGATQETYHKYRRGGRIDWVYDNLRRIVQARSSRGSNLPYIEWKYLTFAHNVHEVEQAVEVGRGIGVDEVHIETPFSVELDDPQIEVVESPKKGRHKFNESSSARGPLDDWTAFEEVDSAIDDEFERPWIDRGERRNALDQTAFRGQPPTCDWLYQSITLDALERVMPCCIPPRSNAGYVYGQLRGEGDDPFNARKMCDSRLAFSDREIFDMVNTDPTPYCASCNARPSLTYSLRNTYWDLLYYERCGLFDPRIFDRLSDWATQPESQ